LVSDLEGTRRRKYFVVREKSWSEGVGNKVFEYKNTDSFLSGVAVDKTTDSRSGTVAKQMGGRLEPVRDPFGVEARYLVGVAADLKACFVELSCHLVGEAVVLPNCFHSVFDKNRVSEEEETKFSGVVTGVFP
jgi:hypothetical protein